MNVLRDFPTIGVEFWDEWTCWFWKFIFRCKWTALKILIHHKTLIKRFLWNHLTWPGLCCYPTLDGWKTMALWEKVFDITAPEWNHFHSRFGSRALRDCKVQRRKRMGGCWMLFSSVFLETTWTYCRSLGHHGNQAQMSSFSPHFSSAARISRFTDYTSCIESDVGISVVLLCVLSHHP